MTAWEPSTAESDGLAGVTPCYLAAGVIRVALA